MCNPMLVIMAVTTVASIASQQQAANAQEKANEQQYQNSMAARAENFNQVGLRRNQEAASAAEKLNQNNIAAREAQASVLARGGPSGLSLDALLADIGRRQASYNDSVNANFERVDMALQNQLTNVNRQSSSEINSLRSPQQPDYLGAALKIGGAAYGAYSGSQGTQTGSNTNDYRGTTLPNSLRGGQ